MFFIYNLLVYIRIKKIYYINTSSIIDMVFPEIASFPNIKCYAPK